jgi:hypothetical protein
MTMNFEQRPYSGTNFRPRPEVFIDNEMRTVIIATPWGQRSAARTTVERMREYLVLTTEDSEATSPYQRLSCLSTPANNLRVAALLANEALYRHDNQTEYHNGVELFAGTLTDNEYVWLQIGFPQVLLSRRGCGLQMLGAQMDLAADMSEGGELLPALPQHLLGLDSSLNLVINSFRYQQGDRLILLSHSQLPASLYQMESQQINLDSLAGALAKDRADSAFWLGILDFGDALKNESLVELT